MSKTVLFKTIQLSIQKLFHFKLVCSLNVKIVLFQAMLFSISAQFSSIWPIDRTLSSATTSSQCGPGSNGNEGILCVPQSSSIVLFNTIRSNITHLFACRQMVPNIVPYHSLSQLYALRDERQVTVHLQFCGELVPGFVKNSILPSCMVPI